MICLGMQNDKKNSNKLSIRSEYYVTSVLYKHLTKVFFSQEGCLKARQIEYGYPYIFVHFPLSF